MPDGNWQIYPLALAGLVAYPFDKRSYEFTTPTQVTKGFVDEQED
jgi:hypothetical protein